VTLDAGATSDPDGHQLRFAWFHYPEASGSGSPRVQVTIDGAATSRAVVTVAAAAQGRGAPSSPGVPAPPWRTSSWR